MRRNTPDVRPPSFSSGYLNLNGECIWRHDCGTKDPERCDAATGQDLYTQDMTRELHEALCTEFGRCPTTIINLLHRVNEATFGVPEVVEAWNYYHGLLEEARQNQTTQALVLDIHGHGHAVDWAELGYLVAGYNLDSDVSTIQELLTGAAPVSFGGLLESEGYLAVPSPTNPGPDGESYFSGGYITQQYGSRDEGIVDAIQIESPLIFREEPQRSQYVAALARVVKEYLIRHHHN
ncbi:hypothetical protein LSH36_886g00047 [Paralvinella palmiformis]|uniref:Uncharacterized protein n=1 Tax=Paralvinella palmiformis TaxID=53620 RepID=A0AAD9IXY9_9ANNE|nr:hypothetical protein LSH36_886g00047 [Paralvinella palmiformis]